MVYSRIGIIGAGVMGEALIVSLLRSRILPASIFIYDVDLARAREMVKKYGVRNENVSNCDVIFIILKPQDCQGALRVLHNQIEPNSLVISFVAGKKLSFFEDFLAIEQRMIRVMPNTPMLVGKGFCAISRGKFATSEDFDWLKEVLSLSSVVREIPENHQDAITALSGSGPAYLFAMVEAMTRAGERLGLTSSVSQEAAIRAVVGAAAMLEFSGKEPKTLRANVTSPNGTTAAALDSFELNGWEEIVYEAMKAAMDRSKELSN